MTSINSPAVGRSRRDTKPRLRAVSAITVTALTLIYFGVATSISSDPIALGAITTLWVSSSCIALLALRRKLDKTSPIVWMNVAFLVMFGLHPLAMLATGLVNAPYHYRFSLAPTYSEAVALGLLATVTFNAGVLVFRGLTGSARTPTFKGLGAETSPDVLRRALLARRFGWALLIMALIGYSAFAISIGSSPLQAILGGARRGDVVTSTAYLYYAPQLIGPATILFLYSALLRRVLPVGAVLLALTQLLLFLPGGQRLVLLLTLLPVVLAYSVLRNKRLSVLGLTATVVGSLLVLISMRDLGADEKLDIWSALGRTVSDPSAQILEFLTGDDTEMIDALAIEVATVPSQLPFQPFSVLQSTLASPIPSILWADKPAPMDSTLNAFLFATDRSSAGLAYSFVGELYFDSGVVGIVIGFTMLAIAANLVWRMRMVSANPTVMLIYCALVPCFVSLVRGSLAYALARALFTVGPLLLYWWLEKRQARVVERQETSDRSSKGMLS